MSADPARIPVIVGVGQSIERDEVVDAVDLAERAARAAGDEAPGVLPQVERISMVGVSFSKTVSRPAEVLARRLGLHRASCEITSAGGSLPQWLINRASREIAAGKLGTTLIVGAEATRSMRVSDPGANFLAVANANISVEMAGETVGPPIRGVLGPSESAIRLGTPAEFYPMIENVLAAAARRSSEGQRAHVAPLLSRFSKVAASHPFAWFPEAKSAVEIARVTAENRLISEPYTRSMNSFPNVDQGAAVLMTSLKVAREIRVTEGGVFPWSGADLSELQPCLRADLRYSQALAFSGQATLLAAGIDADDLAHFDLYSCFPVAVELAAESLGISIDDERGLTVTGGLPFFGGPGNNYSTHAIATLVGQIRETKMLGYISANGGYLSKHSAGVYGPEPPKKGFRLGDTTVGKRVMKESAKTVALDAEGDATVDAGTVTYAKDGTVRRAPIIATLDDGRRIAALADSKILPELAGMNIVSRRVRIGGSPPTYWL